MNVFFSALVRCLVGCNAGACDAQSLHVVDCDAETGSMTMVQTIDTVQGTTYFCFDRDRRNVYTYIRESSGAKACGSIVRFEVKDGKLGKLEKLADLPSGMPCHIAISPDGSRLGFACYSSACVGTLSVDGGDVRYVVHDNSGLGTDRARQEKAHAHCALFTPDGKFFGAVDLGKDAVLFYEPETMKTVPSMTVRLDPGDGPRHAVFSKDARHLFVLNELSNSVVSFAFDGRKFTRVGKWSTLPEGFGEWSKASAIKLTRDDSVIMASNRGYKRNSIAIYSVDAAKGTLKLRNIATVDGVFPRDFELSPDERFVIVGHKRSDEICMYRFDRASFALTPFGGRMKVFKPLCFGFFDTIR